MGHATDHPVIGVDPGVSGGIALLMPNHRPLLWPMPSSDIGIVNLIRELPFSVNGTYPMVHMENLNGFCGRALPGSRMFTMGRNAGILWGAFAACGYTINLVAPQSWQRNLGLSKVKGDTKSQWKMRLRLKAMALYPGQVGLTLKTCDALLIAHQAIAFSGTVSPKENNRQRKQKSKG